MQPTNDRDRDPSAIDHFENAINEISDKDWSWWPFLWLRPEKDVPIALNRLISMALLYGVPCTALLFLAVSIVRPELQRAAIQAAMINQLFFLFMTSGIIGPMWNRRATRLQEAKARVPVLDRSQL
jgi:hypothetical protein